MLSLLNYQVTCDQLDDITALQSQWKKIEEQSNCSFFLSWHWIETWLRCFEPTTEVLRIYYLEELVGIALLVRSKEIRHGVITSNRLMLHETGDVDQDQVWIEYNGILSVDCHEENVLKTAIDFITTTFKGWDEMVIGAISESYVRTIKAQAKLANHVKWHAPTYGVDLAVIRVQGVDYLSTLSRNTRYQINRAHKEYKKLGTINLSRAENEVQALAFFSEIAPLHKKRWGSKKGQSGFANPAFVNFHNALIKSAWGAGNIDLWKLEVDGKVVSYFYNFIYRNKVYFYLSGLDNPNSAKLKPGMLGHALCIEFYLQNNLDYYDLMGGGERYKASLAKRSVELFKIAVQKPKLKFYIEDTARSIKNLLN